MIPAEYDSSPKEIRSFAALQVVITAVFLIALFLILGGVSAPRPPWWAMLALLVPVAIAAWFAERVWTRTPSLDPETDEEEQRRRAVAIFAGQTVRRLAICQVPVILTILVTFVAPWGAWPLVVAAVPAVALLAWETTPTLHSTSLTEVLLDADGAQSGLVEAFKR
ncbi:hypothetical protein [Aeromicrobium sp. CTD01-1L150]|uniref:hypothetical protein n=1 Tax=Aeromicrobium sp. CTD01-1L150 TaxID=3341830 RepID=UPI0035C0FE42